MENLWDQRYSEPGFVYGREPNGFFKEFLDNSPPGKLLLPGEGEGRNAVYAAGKGWDVTAFDQSSVARDKAVEWAEQEKLAINYYVSELSGFDCRDGSYDLVAIIYIHLPPGIRTGIHRKLARCLKPGSRLIMECFHKDQLKYGTGGPPVEELLYLEEDGPAVTKLLSDQGVNAYSRLPVEGLGKGKGGGWFGDIATHNSKMIFSIVSDDEAEALLGAVEDVPVQDAAHPIHAALLDLEAWVHSSA